MAPQLQTPLQLRLHAGFVIRPMVSALQRCQLSFSRSSAESSRQFSGYCETRRMTHAESKHSVRVLRVPWEPPTSVSYTRHHVPSTAVNDTPSLRAEPAGPSLCCMTPGRASDGPKGTWGAEELLKSLLVQCPLPVGGFSDTFMRQRSGAFVVLIQEFRLDSR